MKKTLLTIITLTAFTLLSCSERKAEETDSVFDKELNIEGKTLASNLPEGTPSTDLYSNGKTKLVKTVNYRFEVDNVKKCTDAIEVALKKYPAYIASSNLHLENPILENKIIIRVQNEYFGDLLKDIDAQARFVNFRDVKTEDVSKEFVDLESRLKTKREVEQRYMEILRRKAGTIEELLKAEEQIGALHEEIEATISRVNYLKDEVKYSTLNLEYYQTITQEIKVATEAPLYSKFMNALTTGWTGVVSIALALVYIWPLLIMGIAVLIFYKYKVSRSVN